MDTVIGRMSAEEERAERARVKAAREKAAAEARRDEEEQFRRATAQQRRYEDPDRWFRRTSPLYWLKRLTSSFGWLLGTHRGRIVTAIGLLLAAIISGVVGGLAQDWYEQVFASPGP